MNIVSIYIPEAHAQNEWPISSSRCNGGRGIVAVDQHTTMQERRDIASIFVELFDYAVPMYCDSMDNVFTTVFGAWPLRFYVFGPDGTLKHAAMPMDCVYSLEELQAEMDKHC